MTPPDPDTVLKISAPAELNAVTFTPFREKTRASILPAHRRLDVDLGQTTFVDSSGLGALIALQKTMDSRSGSVRLLNPRQNVLQILELTRMHRIFEIARAA
jgi:anti-sigma B factor antagonist